MHFAACFHSVYRFDCRTAQLQLIEPATSCDSAGSQPASSKWLPDQKKKKRKTKKKEINNKKQKPNLKFHFPIPIPLARRFFHSHACGNSFALICTLFPARSDALSLSQRCFHGLCGSLALFAVCANGSGGGHSQRRRRRVVVVVGVAFSHWQTFNANARGIVFGPRSSVVVL